jgi:hypothetical protein
LTVLGLEITVLVLACAGALYGIWAQPERKIATATVSTVIMTLGLIAAAGLAAWQSIESDRRAMAAEHRHQDLIAANLASSDLTGLRIVWSFDAVPPEVLLAFPAGDMIVDSELLGNEDIDRMGGDPRGRAIGVWFLVNTFHPLVASIDAGRLNVEEWYGNDLAAEIRRFEAGGDGWITDCGSHILYGGPTQEVIFPLNLQLNAALSLGKRADDPEFPEPTQPWHEDIPYLYDQANYGFKTRAERHGSGFTLCWEYSDESLARAVVRSSVTKITAGLPRSFSFAIVHQEVSREGYLTEVVRNFETDEPSERASEVAPWTSRSVLEIYVNGKDGKRYVFDVTNAGLFAHFSAFNAYDGRELEHEYTRFDCQLREIKESEPTTEGSARTSSAQQRWLRL